MSSFRISSRAALPACLSEPSFDGFFNNKRNPFQKHQAERSETKFWHVDAFTSKPFAGNPAVVIILLLM
jgi:hypothetical protein